MIPTISLAIYAGYGFHRTSAELVRESSARILETIGARQRLLLKQAEQMLLTIAESNEARSMDFTGLSRDMAALVLRNTLYSTMGAASPEGKMVASSFAAPDLRIDDREYFRLAKETRGFVVGSIVANRSTGVSVIPAALPLYAADDTLSLVLIVTIPVSALVDSFIDLTLPEGISAEIIDRNGNPLFRLPAGRAFPAPQKGTARGMDLSRAASVILQEEIRVDTAPKAAFRAVLRARSDFTERFGYQPVFGLLAVAVISAIASIALADFLYQKSIGRRITALRELAENIGGVKNEAIRPGDGVRNELALLERTLVDSGAALKKHERELRDAADAVRSSLRDKDVLIKEIHHRVKNNFQVISSLLSLQEMSINDAEILRLFEESRNRIQSMSLIHEQLYQTEAFSSIDFGDYARSLVDHVSLTYREISPEISVTVTAGTAPLTLDAAIPLGLILNELLSNCYKHAFASGSGGTIEIRLEAGSGNRAVLSVADDGVGLPESPSAHRPGSLGLDLVHTLSAQLLGTLTARPAFPGRAMPGAQFTLDFPLQPDLRWTDPPEARLR